jgi:alanine transaminase
MNGILKIRCGVRSGYLEVFNLDPEVKFQLDKLASVRLCSSSIGQACMAGVVNPPKKGEQSYDLFEKEKNVILNGLKDKAQLVTSLFNKIEGVTCNTVQGAMYAFPKIQIPQRAIEKARSLNIQPDVFYCFQLLEQTGICVVPGSGFHQRPDTFHFRTTILPKKEDIKSALTKFEKFHVNFTKQWS